MAESRQTQKEKDREHAQKRSIFLIDRIFGLLSKLVDGAVILGLGYLFYLSVASLAGKSTDVNAFLSLVFKMNMDRWIAYALGGAGLTTGVIERRVRQKSIRDRNNYIKELELRIDPNRTSSSLTSSGTPPKGH